MIRAATEGDAVQILSLIRELADYEELAGHVVCTVDDLRRDLFGPGAVVHATLVIDDTDGGVAGMALWFKSFSTFLGSTGIWLEDLYIREPYRRKGYGRDLLRHLRAQTEGRVEWEVLDWNQPAIAFYRGLGASPLEGWTKFRWA